MKYYLIVGEASGDMHAARLMRSLKKRDPGAEFRFYGGDRMLSEGGQMVRHYKTLAYMGFVEVAVHLGTILRGIKQCREDILRYRPDVLILVDYADFNMRVARYVHKRGIRTVYYIAPQVWAWRTHRIKKLKRRCDKIFVLLPFERKFYEPYGVEPLYEGNPLVDTVSEYRPDLKFIEEFHASETAAGKPAVLMLPGSRKHELKRIFPLMLQAAALMPQYRYVVAGAPNLEPSDYAPYLEKYPQVELVFGHTYDLMKICRGGMIKSGTSTLEAAMFGLPQVVCYKAHPLSYRLARGLVNKNVKYISLVNLILDKPAVKELLQNDLTPQNICRELVSVCEEGNAKTYQQDNYNTLREIMGKGGTSDRVAGSIFSILGN